MDEEVEASPVARQTPWPIGLDSVEERKKKSASGSRSNSCRRSSNSCGGKKKKEKRGGGNRESGLRSCWNNTGSKSCWSFRGSNSKGAISWKCCSNHHHKARPSQYCRRRRGLRLERRDCRYTVRRPLRGSV